MSPDVSIAISSVSRVTLLGLSLRQYSFYLCRYIHLAVQSQSGNQLTYGVTDMRLSLL